MSSAAAAAARTRGGASCTRRKGGGRLCGEPGTGWAPLQHRAPSGPRQGPGPSWSGRQGEAPRLTSPARPPSPAPRKRQRGKSVPGTGAAARFPRSRFPGRGGGRASVCAWTGGRGAYPEAEWRAGLQAYPEVEKRAPCCHLASGRLDPSGGSFSSRRDRKCAVATVTE